MAYAQEKMLTDKTINHQPQNWTSVSIKLQIIFLFTGLKHRKKMFWVISLPCCVDCIGLKWMSFFALTFCRWMAGETVCCSCCHLQAAAHWAESVTWSDHDGWRCQPIRTTPNSWTYTQKHTCTAYARWEDSISTAFSLFATKILQTEYI